MFVRGMFFLSMLMLALPSYASNISDELSLSDQKLFSTAREDFRFSAFSEAIPKFERLHQRYPAHAKIVEHLGSSYVSTGRSEEALSLYGQWLEMIPNNHEISTRFAWLGMANALLKLKKETSAISSLQQWVSYHPDDAVASIMYGSLLVRKQGYAESEKIWDRLLEATNSSEQDKAAVHYFKALNAYVRGDFEKQKFHAAESLRIESEGPYVSLAQKLLESRPARKLGLSMSLGLEEFYTSNVDLLPNFKTLAVGQKKSDTVTQVDVSLNYNFSNFFIGYTFNEGFHANRVEFDLAYHSLYGMWSKHGWFISPRYEYAQLGGSYLFQGGGADIGWGSQAWHISYGLRVKKFTSDLSGSDLRRFGGISNQLNLSKLWRVDGLSGSVSLGVSDEAAKGDATFAQSDAYRQTSGGMRLAWVKDSWRISGGINAYIRKYREAQPLSTLAIRRDRYHKLQAKLAWQSESRNAWQLSINAGRQNNSSNDASKTYSEWRTGAAVQMVW